MSPYLQIESLVSFHSADQNHGFDNNLNPYLRILKNKFQYLRA